jgi:hypothetical protein
VGELDSEEIRGMKWPSRPMRRHGYPSFCCDVVAEWISAVLLEVLRLHFVGRCICSFITGLASSKIKYNTVPVNDGNTHRPVDKPKAIY